MKEKLQTLSLAALRDIAKDKKIKNITIMRKSDLVEAILLAVGEGQQPDASANSETASTLTLPEKAVEEKSVQQVQAQHGVTQQNLVQQNPEVREQKRFYTTNNQPARQERTERQSSSASSTRSDNRHDNRADNRHDNRSEATKFVEESLSEDTYINEETSERAHNEGGHRYERKQMAEGILEILTEGYGFIRCENFLPGENDIYVSPAQIRKFGLRTGDVITGPTKLNQQNEKFGALYTVDTVNGKNVFEVGMRPAFEKLTPIFPNERIHLEPNSSSVAMRVMDLISPIGKGQRGMIVSQPKAGKTTLLKQVANAITKNNPEMHLIILLIDERPEEVTDIKESIEGKNVEVIYSTFDELPERHKRVSEMVIERAKRLVEQKQDVIILLDSITRLARAYNLTVQASGRTLSGGLDPAALHMPKRFFGAARNMREGGSLTILATALVDTGSKMDDVVFEEFKGTGNMELILDRKLSEKRIFPAIDIAKSGTRREDLLMTPDELEAVDIMRKALNGLKADEATDKILGMFARTQTNAEFIELIKKNRLI